MKRGRFPAAYWWVWAGSLVNYAGSFVVPFFAYYLTGRQGFGPAQVGLVATLYGAGGVASTVAAGVAADRFGRRPTLLVAQLAAAAATLAVGFADGLPLIAVLAFVLGFTAFGAAPVLSALVADVVPEQDRKRAYALHYWAVNLGFAAAPVLAGLLAGHDYRWLFAGDALTTALCAVLIAWRVPEVRATNAEEKEAASGPGLLHAVRDRALITLLLTVFGIVVVYTQYQVTQPIAMREAGLSPAVYGLVSAVNGAVIVVFQPLVARLAERCDDSRLLAAGALLLGVGMASTAFAHSAAGFAACVAVWTLGEAIAMPTSNAVVARLAPPGLQGRYQGLYAMTWALAAVAAPLAGGWTFGCFGGAPVWAGCLVLGTLAAGGAVVLGRGAERPVPTAETLTLGARN
ncbi:MDR family MFS transporter [Streptoverticillium reticulum]|uniref:MDR family MFS transporter n=1 Tax=Streptoverticillium reticulum TaxID=1433415 RepID=UPI0039BF6E3F